MLDGEIVIAGDGGLEFEALLLRIHPAASRVKMLAEQSPASFVAWDLLALGDEDLRARSAGRAPGAAWRPRWPAPKPPIHLTPATTDLALAADWFDRFEGAGLDGVVAKRLDASYQPGKRAMLKIKHQRTADCVVAGFRWHKNGPGTHVGSLLLGLYDDDGNLHHVGDHRLVLLGPAGRADDRAGAAARGRHGGPSVAAMGRVGGMGRGRCQRPAASGRHVALEPRKDLSWEPLRPERVVEVAYDHLQGDRFRHATTFVRWRPDKQPADCRYDQLEVTAPFELGAIFGSAAAAGTGASQ